MTLPSVARVFFAIAIQEPVQSVLADYLGQLKKQANTRVIRWSRPENLHITLQFLAEVQVSDIEQLVHHVKARLAGEREPITFQLSRLHVFPDPYRPRVIVMDISPQVPLEGLSIEIGEGVLASGYAIEDRPYRAHMTLGRIKHPQGFELGFLSEVDPPVLPPIPVNEVVLFQSTPAPNGSTYTPLASIPLG